MGFSITGTDSDSWYDGLKINWYEIYGKTNEQTKKYADNAEMTEAERFWWRMQCPLRREGEVNKTLNVSVGLNLKPGAVRVVYTEPAGYTLGRPVFLSWKTGTRSWVTMNIEKIRRISEGKMLKRGYPNQAPLHFDLTTKKV